MSPEVNRRVGRWLRALRQRHAMKQVELAALLGVAFQQTNKYERGQNALPLHHLPVLVGRLGADLDELLEAIAGDTVPPTAAPKTASRLFRAVAGLTPDRQRALAQFLAPERSDG